MKRSSTAHWSGSGKEGKGHLTTQSSVLNQTQYSFGSRFDVGIGTNPEELMAAAHAGCFSMKLSFILGAAGFTPESIVTTCTITLESGAVTLSRLVVKASVPECPDDVLAASVKDAEQNCPISKLLSCEITSEIA
jgi:osmotically inducible protein OsmC